MGDMRRGTTLAGIVATMALAACASLEGLAGDPVTDRTSPAANAAEPHDSDGKDPVARGGGPATAYGADAATDAQRAVAGDRDASQAEPGSDASTDSGDATTDSGADTGKIHPDTGAPDTGEADAGSDAPAPTQPDLSVATVTIAGPYYVVSFCNSGAPSGSTFTVSISNVGTGQSFTSNQAYPFVVPAMGTCAKTGGFSCTLIGPACGASIQVRAMVDNSNTVVESDETNNTRTVQF